MIEYLISFDISIMSLILLVVLIIITRLKHDHFSFTSQLLKAITIITILGVFLELSTWLIEGVEGRLAYQIGYITNSLVLLLGTVLSAIWISYWDYKFFASKKRIVQMRYYLIPTFVQLMLMIFNRLTKTFFEIEAGTNIFIAKPLYFVLYLVYMFYFIYMVYLIIKNNKKIDNKTIVAAFIFMTFPIISVLTQLFIPQLIFSWPSLTISLLLVYLFLEMTTGNVDDLTKLYSRRLLEQHLKTLVEDKKSFYSIMIDLDHFKDVNDLYGHMVGDQVLVHFASILKKCDKQNDSFIARLGGDEFFMIHQSKDESQIEEYIEAVKDMMKQDAFFVKFPFLGFSVGIILFNEKMTFDDVFNLTDKRMYEQKVQRHVIHQESIQNKYIDKGVL